MIRCPKCKYVRQPNDAGPEYECPRCGVIYSKFNPDVEAQRESVAAKARERSVRREEKVAKLKALSEDQALRATQVSPNDLICSSCGTVGEYRRVRPGTDAIEIVLWMCGIVPGLIYTSWRNSKKTTACTHCAAMTMIAAGSPVGRALLASTSPDIQIVATAAPRRPQMTTGERLVARAGRIALWILVAMLAIPTIFALISRLF